MSDDESTAKVPKEEDDDNLKQDIESTQQKLPYPKSVFFIVICEFCERFCYYGMRAVLTLYLKNVLKFDEDFATVIYHLFTMFCYFTPLLGAMLADSLLGKFRTIFYLSIVYSCGSVILSLAAADPLNIPQVPFSMIGLGLIAIGTGGIKPCVSAFGGDQFQIPGQEKQLGSFFAIFYFAINSGSLVSTLVTPIFREDISCLDAETCYPLAFGVPAVLMIFALIVFVIGRPLYIVHDPQGNVVLRVLGAIKHSLSRRSSEIKAGRNRPHWMDYGDDKYEKRFLEDVKIVLKVLFLYLPLPVFWALFDQQGSRWTFQATRMNGNTFGWLIKPDQMQVVNPLMVLIFIPIFDKLIYPLLSKFGLLKKPLQRLTVGGIFAGIAFTVSGFIELTLEPTYAIELSQSQASIHFINTLPCPVSVEMTYTSDPGYNLNPVNIEPDNIYLYSEIRAGFYTAKIKTATGNTNCASIEPEHTFILPNSTGEAFTKLIVVTPENEIELIQTEEPDELEKSEGGEPKIRVLHDGLWARYDIANPWITKNITVTLNKDDEDQHMIISSINGSDFIYASTTVEVDTKKHDIYIQYEKGEERWLLSDEEIDPKLGGNYILSIVRNGPSGGEDKKEYYKYKLHTITEPNSVHMLWLLPQYLIMTMGEIMFSITIMDFSYAEAPASMKSVMQSAWLMTVAFGNLIVVIVAESKFFEQQWKEFFLFAGLMYVDMVLFSYMAYLYVPAKLTDDTTEEVEGISDKKAEAEASEQQKINPAFDNDE